MDSLKDTNNTMLSPRHLVNILFIRKRLIVVVFGVIVVSVALLTFLMEPTYRSSSKIIVEREPTTEKALLFKMSLPTYYERYDWINSEIETITSYPVAAMVVRSLVKDALINDPDFDPDDVVQFNRKISEFQSHLMANHGKNSNIIEISYDSPSPVLAAEVVKRVIKVYINYRAELYSDSETLKFLENQIKIADKKLSELEKRQADFKSQQSVVSPAEQKNILLTKLADYEKNLTAVRTRRMGKEAKLSVIRQQLLRGEEINFPSTETSDSPSREKYIAKLKGELLDLEMRKEQLLQKFTPEYEEVINLENQIKVTKEKIATEIQQIIEQESTSIQALKAQEEVLQSAIDEIHDELSRFAEKEYMYNRISRGITDSREVYSMLLKQKEEAQLSLSKLQQGVKIKVVSPAIVPLDPFKPKKKINLLLAGFLGVFLSLSLAFFAEFFNHTFTYPDEVEKNLGITMLGSVRDMQAGQTSPKRFRRYGKKTQQDPYFAA